jgi:hypothetical protein
LFSAAGVQALKAHAINKLLTKQGFTSFFSPLGAVRATDFQSALT